MAVSLLRIFSGQGVRLPNQSFSPRTQARYPHSFVRPNSSHRPPANPIVIGRERAPRAETHVERKDQKPLDPRDVSE